MAGFQKPTRPPVIDWISALTPFSCGATKLVPPNCCQGDPNAGVNSRVNTAYPVCGSASVDRSGVSRLFPLVPDTSGPPKSTAQSDGSLNGSVTGPSTGN